jgi:NADH:ubiquinone oxidoreductase subunit E
VSTPEPEVKRFSHGSRVPGWDQAVDLWKDPAPVPDPATTPVPDELRAEVEAYMAKYPDRRSAAIPALAAAQRLHGWCSPEAIDQVASVMRLTPGYLTAVATFYDMLETEPKPRHDVYVCTNISCSLRGGDEVFSEMQAAAGGDPDLNVRSFECLGACDIAPMASVDGVYVGPLEPGDAHRIVEDVKQDRPVLEEKQLARRLAADTEALVRAGGEPARAEPGRGAAPTPPERAAAGPRMGDDGPTGGEPAASDHGEQRDLPPEPEKRQGT